jgi:phosphopantothenate synthetase
MNKLTEIEKLAMVGKVAEQIAELSLQTKLSPEELMSVNGMMFALANKHLAKLKLLKRYEVTISLVVGYNDDEERTPKLKHKDFEVEAENETEAIEKAKELETSLFSIWESNAYQIDEEDRAEEVFHANHPELNP